VEAFETRLCNILDVQHRVARRVPLRC